jgi:hypothetical protein
MPERLPEFAAGRATPGTARDGLRLANRYQVLRSMLRVNNVSVSSASGSVKFTFVLRQHTGK